MAVVYTSALLFLGVCGAFLLSAEQHTTTSESHGCDRTSDCAEGFCCLSNLHLVGRRQVLTNQRWRRSRSSAGFAGHCQALGQLSDKCYLNDRQDPSRIYYGSSCPCAHSLVCHHVGVSEMPFGPVGNCTK